MASSTRTAPAASAMAPPTAAPAPPRIDAWRVRTGGRAGGQGGSARRPAAAARGWQPLMPGGRPARPRRGRPCGGAWRARCAAPGATPRVAPQPRLPRRSGAADRSHARPRLACGAAGLPGGASAASRPRPSRIRGRGAWGGEWGGKKGFCGGLQPWETPDSALWGPRRALHRRTHCPPPTAPPAPDPGLRPRPAAEARRPAGRVLSSYPDGARAQRGAPWGVLGAAGATCSRRPGGKWPPPPPRGGAGAPRGGGSLGARAAGPGGGLGGGRGRGSVR
jgi:hypothetical protein